MIRQRDRVVSSVVIVIEMVSVQSILFCAWETHFMALPGPEKHVCQFAVLAEHQNGWILFRFRSIRASGWTNRKWNAEYCKNSFRLRLCLCPGPVPGLLRWACPELHGLSSIA